MFAQFAALHVNKLCVCPPDGGRGKQRWESAGFKWQDQGRNFYGVTDSGAIGEIFESDDDPLKHRDVVALPH